MIDLAQRPEYINFANERLDVKFPPFSDRTAWITKLGQDGIEAVVVFTNFTDHNCEMSIATNKAKKWATKGFLGVCFRYAFNQMKLKRVTAMVDVNNKDSLELVGRLGYQKEGEFKNWFGNRDAVAVGMLAENCKWIQEKAQ